MRHRTFRRFALAGWMAFLSIGIGVPAEGQQRVANPGGVQNEGQLLRPSGGPVVPFFDGWYQNPDGTYELSFGYFNVNTEEEIEIPLGAENVIEPREFDGIQPTRFYPIPDRGYRHWGVFTVTVPEDFGDRDVVWTLVVRGQELSVPGRLRSIHYNLDALDQPGRLTVAPTLWFDRDGAVGIGPAGAHADPMSARIGDPVSLTVWTDRKNPHRNDSRPINLIWYKHQGPGDVSFDPAEHRVPVGGSVPAMTAATFSEPGEYVLRVLAYNGMSDFDSLCCWTNGYVRVNVTP